MFEIVTERRNVISVTISTSQFKLLYVVEGDAKIISKGGISMMYAALYIVLSNLFSDLATTTFQKKFHKNRCSYDLHTHYI